jgi:hypothetical protein
MRPAVDVPGRGDFGRRDRGTVGAAIAELIHAAEVGRARSPAGEPYTRSEVRELRIALGEIEAELGSLPLRLLRHRHVDALLEDLRREGLSAHRERAILDALDALYVQEEAAAKESTTGGRTPTDAILALGTKVAWWASATVFALFAGLLVLIAVTFT